jgi:hypothetical protein
MAALPRRHGVSSSSSKNGASDSEHCGKDRRKIQKIPKEKEGALFEDSKKIRSLGG